MTVSWRRSALPLGEGRAETRFRAVAHGAHLLVQLFRIEARQKPLGQFAQPAALLGEPAPLVVVEEAEMRTVLGKSMQSEMQPRDDRRPRRL